MPGRCFQAQSSQAAISFVLRHELSAKPFSLVREECIRFLVNDTIASDKLTPTMLHLYWLKMCLLLLIMSALLHQRKVVLRVLACPNFPLATLGLQSSTGQNGFLFSAVIGEGTYMESLVGSSPKLGVKAPPVRIDSQEKYGALSRGDWAIKLQFPTCKLS
ncbi:SAL1 phosphatase [Bienertia sinuspersici]